MSCSKGGAVERFRGLPPDRMIPQRGQREVKQCPSLGRCHQEGKLVRCSSSLCNVLFTMVTCGRKVEARRK